MPAGVTVRPRKAPTVLPHQDGRAAAQRGRLGPTRLERRQPGPADKHEERSRASESPAHGAPRLKPGGAVPLRFPKEFYIVTQEQSSIVEFKSERVVTARLSLVGGRRGAAHASL